MRYYFGLPVTSGHVAWRVTRQPELPWWWRWWGFAGGSTEAQPIASGTTTLAVDGKFQRRLHARPPTSSDKAKGLTYLYRLEADVTDDGGETRTGERTVRLGWSAVEALAEKPADLAVEGKPFAIAVRRQDLNGAPRPGEGSWRLLRLEPPAAALLPADLPLRPADAPAEPADRFATPGDRLRPRWTGATAAEQALAFFADGKEVASGALRHEASGRGTIPLAGLGRRCLPPALRDARRLRRDRPHAARLRRRRTPDGARAAGRPRLRPRDRRARSAACGCGSTRG